jgi:hypothetical protein
VLTRKWEQGANQLLEVRLDGTDDLVAFAINVYLADVIQHGMGLVTVA